MTERKKWTVGSHQYVKRPGQATHSSLRTEAALPASLARRGSQLDACAVTWDRNALEFERITEHTVERSRHRFRASLPHLVWNAAALEGNTFTLPEVQTLLDGVTVGGRPTEDAKQIIALSEGYSRVAELVGAERFSPGKSTSDELHALVAVHEAIESGRFRGEGQATGGGSVRLANGGFVPGFPEGKRGELLIERYDRTLSYLDAIEDPRERALAYFTSATRQQFYFDGNKRTARLMMSGELMSHGFDAVSVPFARRYEFNRALDELFTNDDEATDLMRFLISCADPD